MRISDWSSDVCSSDLAALGVKNTSQWSKDLDNAANKAFVAAFQQAYGRLPSLYASQGYDTANLILAAWKQAGGVADKDAFQKALGTADFASTRGSFKFDASHHPIQDIYVREVVKEGEVLTNKIVGIGLKQHRSEEHTSELQSLMRISYAVFCLKKK